MNKIQGVKQRVRYPTPGPTGGVLIRQVIKLLRVHQVKLPINSHILIGVSGGADSMALAHLLAKYGRRVVDQSKIRIVHINHGWRGKASDEDAQFVKRQAKKWKAPCHIFRVKNIRIKGESCENEARKARHKIFQKLSQKYGASVFTAHHADDLFETVLWRLFTGSSLTHGGGILIRDGIFIRPLLTTYKSELLKFLEEEGVSWRQDATNFEDRFLRNKVRKHLVPVILDVFPKANESLNRLALVAQIQANCSQTQKSQPPYFQEYFEIKTLLSASGIHLRRANWEVIKNIKSGWIGELHLPGGWILKSQKIMDSKDSKRRLQASRRWILEPTLSP